MSQILQRVRCVTYIFVSLGGKIKHVGIRISGIERWLQGLNGVLILIRRQLRCCQVIPRSRIFRRRFQELLKDWNCFFHSFQSNQALTVFLESDWLRRQRRSPESASQPTRNLSAYKQLQRASRASSDHRVVD